MVCFEMCHGIYNAGDFLGGDDFQLCPRAQNPCTRDDTSCPVCSTLCRRDHKFSKSVRNAATPVALTRPFALTWLDEHAYHSPLSPLGQSLASMLVNNVALKSYPGASHRIRKLARKETVATLRGTTPVPGMPQVRVWVDNALEILEKAGLDEDPDPDNPQNTAQFHDTTRPIVYVRFRVEGKLSNAGAGYWLSRSLSHLFTSVYLGLATFPEQQMSDVVDVGLIQGVRTPIAPPYCYSAHVNSPQDKAWSCKKGNIDDRAECVASFRLGDVGVGHPEWVEATKKGGSMNALSQSETTPHHRLLVVMAELLTTRILELINRIE